ncbi:hypothetical protein ACFE04_022430 [Oxalis oulophora]
MALKNEEIHVLMVAFASQGHINPMLRLGKYLLFKGLRVSLATTQYARHLMLQSATIKTTTTDEIPLLFFSDGLSLDYDRKANLDHYMETLGETGKTNLSNLIKEHYFDNKKKLQCIINNPFVPWVADVGNDLGLPCAMLWIQPCSLYSIYYRFYNKLNQFPNDFMTNPNVKLELPGLPPLLVEDLPSFVLPSNPFGSFPKMLSLLFQQQLGVGRYKWVLGNSFLELEKDVIESMVEICPIIPPTNAKLISDVFRVGVRLRPNEDGIITNDLVEKCVREVMDGPNAAELKGNAAKLKAAARAAVVSGGSSDRNIQFLTDHIAAGSSPEEESEDPSFISFHQMKLKTQS